MKTRICPQCGVSELDKGYSLCSECREVNKFFSKTEYFETNREYYKKYQQKYYPKYREKNRKKINEYSKNWMREKRKKEKEAII